MTGTHIDRYTHLHIDRYTHREVHTKTGTQNISCVYFVQINEHINGQLQNITNTPVDCQVERGTGIRSSGVDTKMGPVIHVHLRDMSPDELI